MTDKETAEYLNMSQEKFNSLITYEESQKKGFYIRNPHRVSSI